MGKFKMVVVDFEEYEDAKKAVNASPKELGATPVKRGSEIGQPICLDFILDISGSMSPLYDELVNCFNGIMIPSLWKAHERYKEPMRIGCMLFSDKMVPAWWGYKSLKELGESPLKREMLDQPGLRNQTALYGAMRAGILWTSAAMKHMQENSTGGEIPKGKIMVLSDGANNVAPLETSAVTNALESIGKNRQNIQRVIGFFDTSTNGGLTKPQFETMAKATGFEGKGFYEIAGGDDVEEQRRKFRHKFKIFSNL